MPFYQTGPRPMAERGQVEFRSCDVLPNGKHVPKANVVHDEEKRFMKINGFNLLSNLALENPVLGTATNRSFRCLNKVTANSKNARADRATNFFCQGATLETS